MRLCNTESARVIVLGVVLLGYTGAGQGPAGSESVRVQQLLSGLVGQWRFALTRSTGNAPAIGGQRTFREVPDRPGLLEWHEEFDDRPMLRLSGFFGYAGNRGSFFETSHHSNDWPELHLGSLHAARLEITFLHEGLPEERGILTIESANRFTYRREALSDSAWTERWRAVFTRSP